MVLFIKWGLNWDGYNIKYIQNVLLHLLHILVIFVASRQLQHAGYSYQDLPLLSLTIP